MSKHVCVTISELGAIARLDSATAYAKCKSREAGGGSISRDELLCAIIEDADWDAVIRRVISRRRGGGRVREIPSLTRIG